MRRARRVLLLITVAVVSALPATGRAATTDPLIHRTRAELAVFTNWLKANNAKGYIGEVGWPDNYRGDASKWNTLANRWYKDADAANLWVTAWATGEWWGSSYELAAYEDRGGAAGVDSANTQASIIEAHPSSTYQRGVNDNGGEFGGVPTSQSTSTFSNANSGGFESAYHYDATATFTYLASRGVKIVRVPFRWERIQPTLGGPLDANELARLKDVVARARAAGVKVVLDLHNYGAYYLYDGHQGVRRGVGSTQVPVADFADVWQKLSSAFAGDTTVSGYGLMNEPTGLSSASAWEVASQAALTAVRGNGDNTLIFVPGYNWSSASRWKATHRAGWITDPASNFRYEAHQYFDRDNSGAYAHTYSQEVADARSRGY